VTTDCVVSDETGRIALIRRRNDPFKNSYALPGGFVEAGETVESACIREVKEETGLDVSDLRLIGVYSEPRRDPRGHVISIAFAARADLSRLKAAARRSSALTVQNAHARWNAPVNLPTLVPEHVKRQRSVRAECDRRVKPPHTLTCSPGSRNAAAAAARSNIRFTARNGSRPQASEVDILRSRN
jgi:8-oxo-dGTP diphosphatase